MSDQKDQEAAGLTWPSIPHGCAALALFLSAIGVIFHGQIFPQLALVEAGLSTLNSIFHEVGHMVFGMLGPAIGVAGGTMAQLLFPSALLVAALRSRACIAAAAAVFWIGENLIGISSYIADARGLQLEPLQWWAALGGPFLIKGDPSTHDWHTMLNAVGLLWADRLIAGPVYLLGMMLMASAILSLLVPVRRWCPWPAGKR